MLKAKFITAAVCAAAIAMPLLAASKPAPVTLESVIKKVQQQQRKTQTLQADFKQEKELALLSKPEVSMGTFVFSKPNNVLWSYDAPKRGETFFQVAMFGIAANVRSGTKRPAGTVCSGIDELK